MDLSTSENRNSQEGVIVGSTSLWQAEVQATGKALFSIAPLLDAVQTEVAVVGAGITGTATALWLARARIQVRLQRHPIPTRRHSKAQKTTLSQARTYYCKRKERQKQNSASQFVYTKIKQAEVIWATREETQDGRALLHTLKCEECQSYR